MQRPYIDMIGKVAAAGWCLVLASGLAACGDMEPSGGREPQGGAAPGNQVVDDVVDQDAPTPATTDEGSSEDALPAAEWIASLDSPAKQECHEQGFVFDRRRSACSLDVRLATFDCDRQGIRLAYAATGFQIDQILDRSLGRVGFPDDLGEGFVVDQCGQSDERLYVVLVAKAADGRILLREIEAVAPTLPSVD